MRSRPWPLVVLAVLQILSPIGTVLFNAWGLGVNPSYVIDWILQRTPLEIFEAVALIPIAGIAIYLMKTWSYVVFFIAMSWSLLSNLSQWEYAPQNHWMMIGVYALQIGLALYFVIPAVRKTYLDPRVRWWEASPRYELQIPIRLQNGAEGFSGKLVNLSEGGALVRVDRLISTGTKLNLNFEIVGQPIAISGELAHAAHHPDGSHFCGIRFLHTPESQKRFKRLAHGLELIGMHDRDQEAKLPWHRGIQQWAVTALKSGKGLVPEIPSKKK